MSAFGSFGSPAKVLEEDISRHDEICDLYEDGIRELDQGLVPGTELRRKFDTYRQSGVAAYFRRGHERRVIRCMDEYWHRLVLTLRNSLLTRSVSGSWQEDHEKLSRQVIAVAGCSVGSSIAHSVAFDIRPQGMKLADAKAYHLSNANRVQLHAKDIGRNKAEVTAEVLTSVDPFMDVFVYSKGVTESNVRSFVNGDRRASEPKATIVVEETDNLKAKLLIREHARKAGVPVVMASDLGSAVLLDVRRFDQDTSLPLLPGVEDKVAVEEVERFETASAAEKAKMFHGVLSLFCGDALSSLPDYESVLRSGDASMFAGVQQLGSTVTVAAGLTAETVWRIILGYDVPERRLVLKYQPPTRQ